jgi:hypothetical protein
VQLAVVEEAPESSPEVAAEAYLASLVVEAGIQGTDEGAIAEASARPAVTRLAQPLVRESSDRRDS